MTRNTLRGLGLLATFALVMSVTTGAQAKPKKHKGGGETSPPPAADTGSAPSGGGMTFEPEEVHKDAPAGGKKKPMTFTPEASRPTGPAGPPSKVLERALKLYDAEDYANA